jgi:anti-anti-sigma factor
VHDASSPVLLAEPDFSVEALSETVVVRLAGNIGLRESGQLQRDLTPVTARRPRLVVLDLENVTSLSTLALGVLFEFRRGIVRVGGRVRLARVPTCVAEIFRVTGLDDLFPMA